MSSNTLFSLGGKKQKVSLFGFSVQPNKETRELYHMGKMLGKKAALREKKLREQLKKK